jgi:hypothetical protein
MKEALMELNFGSKPFHYKVDIFYGAERPRLGRTLPSASVKASDYRNSTLISCQRGKEDLIIDDLTATNSTTGWLGGIGSERVFSGRTHFEGHVEFRLKMDSAEWDGRNRPNASL